MKDSLTRDGCLLAACLEKKAYLDDSQIASTPIVRLPRLKIPHSMPEDNDRRSAHSGAHPEIPLCRLFLRLPNNRRPHFYARSTRRPVGFNLVVMMNMLPETPHLELRGLQISKQRRNTGE